MAGTAGIVGAVVCLAMPIVLPILGTGWAATEPPEAASNWRCGYQGVGHWVAQFGLIALQSLFGPVAGR
ncbi:hypothetical protein [Bradyrhizobium sp. Tv2a-2]|uniref:hypothetical protein n=1 Tax=Bradyrhizobium sp. Tv2a-2 TaxID=113395 RepID=UPI0012EC3F6B|nr:hypothetical protein [Bradyrhizobium sp. Tv2a-2]